MKRLFLQLWQCRCGRRERERKSEEEEVGREELERRFRFVVEDDESFGKQVTRSHKDVIRLGSKRTSIRGG
jgi:hypothetical protein